LRSFWLGNHAPRGLGCFESPQVEFCRTHFLVSKKFSFEQILEVPS
jgi:hypothetical protein